MKVVQKCSKLMHEFSALLLFSNKQPPVRSAKHMYCFIRSLDTGLILFYEVGYIMHELSLKCRGERELLSFSNKQPPVRRAKHMYCFIRSLSTGSRRLHHTCTITEIQKRKRKGKQNKLTRTVKPVNVITEIHTPQKNLRTSTYVLPLFNIQS